MQATTTATNSPTMTRRLLSVPQVAEILGVSVRLIWRLLAVGELDRVNVGRCVRIPAESIEAFCARGGAR